jgi:hypothetical protein
MSSRLLQRAAVGLLVAPVVVIGTAGTSYAAGNAHFIKSATSFSGSGSTVTVKFKEAGLASGSVETVTVSATALTTYECVNGGGKNPSASNKKTTRSQLSKSGTFSADRSGNIVGSLTLTAPTAAQLGFACPKGQTVTFVSVSYSNITITDTTSGATTGSTGSYSYTNPNAPTPR